jgi:hypothetical protein
MQFSKRIELKLCEAVFLEMSINRAIFFIIPRKTKKILKLMIFILSFHLNFSFTIIKMLLENCIYQQLQFQNNANLKSHFYFCNSHSTKKNVPTLFNTN